MSDNLFRTREIPLSGRMRTADDPATIGPNDLSVCQNMRPSDQFPRGVAGMTKINTSALASTGIRNGIHLRKSQPAESQVLAWTSDGKVWQNDAVIPAQGAFEGTALFTDTAGGSTGRFALAPGGAVAYANGKEACLWGGTKFRCAGFVDIPNATDEYDYSEQVSNILTDSNNVATLHADPVAATYVATFYVGSIMPIKGVYFDMNSVNAVVTSLTVKYWNGSAWTDVTSLSDGTASGGVSLAQDGWVTFASTATTAKPKDIKKTFLYWYKFTITGSSDYSPTINTVYVDIPMQSIKDIWDGDPVPCASHMLYYSSVYHDVTTRTIDDYYDNSEAAGTTVPKTYVDYGTAIGSTGYVYVGFPVRVMGVMFSIGSGYENTHAAVIDELDYWNGDAWTDLTPSKNDGTLQGGLTFAQSGWVTWSSPTSNSEKQITNLPGHSKVSSKTGATTISVSDDVPLYYYRFKFSATIANASDYAVRVYYLAGIPAAKDIQGYSFPLAHQNRVVLCSNMDSRKNSILISAQDTANCFNGLDSYEFFIGNDQEFVAGTPMFLRFGSSVQDMLVLAKNSEIHLLEGNGSANDPYRLRLLSEVIGCRAPLTMTTVPVGDLGGGVRRQLAIWESQRGIEVFDGASLMDPLLSHDIRDKFDPKHANYAGSSSNAGFYDPVEDEYHWCPVGTAEWVYSFKYKKWSQVVRGTGKYLYGGIPVMDTSGNCYIYGFGNTGYLWRLENGTDFDGNSIAHVLKTGAIALNENRISEQTTLRMVKVVQVAKNTTANSMTVTHYGDTATAGNTVDEAFSPAVSGKRLKSRVLNASSKGPHVHHEFQLALTTNDETCGCEPIYIVAYYDGERQDVR